eukprot:9472540-Pyramimonas_sp.AAC.1
MVRRWQSSHRRFFVTGAKGLRACRLQIGQRQVRLRRASCGPLVEAARPLASLCLQDNKCIALPLRGQASPSSSERIRAALALTAPSLPH